MLALSNQHRLRLEVDYLRIDSRGSEQSESLPLVLIALHCITDAVHELGAIFCTLRLPCSRLYV